MTILSILKLDSKAWWRKAKQNAIGWEVLLLFAAGLAVLLTIMTLMSYPLITGQ